MQRLIDADVLMKAVEKDFEGVCVYDVPPSEAVSDFERIVDSMLTIDAEPVRHGYWLPKKIGAVTTEFECSECGRTVTRANDYFGKATKYASSYYPYCHCGAKMDLEVQDEG